VRNSSGNAWLRRTILIAIMIILVGTSLLVIVPLLYISSSPAPVAHATATATATLVPKPTPVLGPPPSLTATEAFVLDPQDPVITMAYHADDRMPMASTTKIMTALVTIISIPDLGQQVVVGSDVTQLESDASRMGCLPKESYSVRELLYGLLLPSGDDAAIALADAVSGSQEAFVSKMNTFAAWLQLNNTHYANVHGLDADGHYSSAHDLAILTEYAMLFPDFRTIVSTPKYTVPANNTHAALVLKTTDQLILPATSFYQVGTTWGVDGVKTGFTSGAGECFVAHARHNGHELIAVVLGEETEAARFKDSVALLQWGFTQLDTIAQTTG
jgi:serine-type D-Ala-D-Ala carboxypeptidase (penicillin-binding protein 5/6)